MRQAHEYNEKKRNKQKLVVWFQRLRSPHLPNKSVKTSVKLKLEE
jgi:hypothetical protein